MTDKRILGHARILRQQQTDAEQKLWYHLRACRFLGHKFKRQKPIGPYIVDFVCMERGVAVELDGGQHLEQVRYDETRTAYLEAEGLSVLRFWNHDVLTETDAVLEQLRLVLEAQALSLGPSPASGRGKTVNSQPIVVDGSPLPPAGEGLGVRACNDKGSL